ADGHKIYDRVFLRLCQYVENFGNACRPFLVAKRDARLERRVVALGIDNDELIFLLVETFHEAGSQCGFPGAGATGNENVLAIRRKEDFSSVGTLAQSNTVVKAVFE